MPENGRFSIDIYLCRRIYLGGRVMTRPYNVTFELPNKLQFCKLF